MARPTPIGILTAGFDWFGRSGRAAFVAALLVWAIFAGVTIYGLDRPDWPEWARAIGLIGLALTTVPLFGHAMRRLNDLGWSGWWVWLLLVPYVGAVLTLLLAVRRGNVRRFATGSPLRLLGMIGVVLLALLILSRLFWTPYLILRGSMKPAVLIGDVVSVTALRKTPERGALIVFRHPVSGQILIARVIGLPGDTVALVNGVVQIDGTSAALTDAGVFDEVMGPQGPLGLMPRCLNGAVGQGATCQKRRWREVLPDGTTQDILNIADTALDNTAPVKVPAGQLFVLGDNRDNSTDSRIAPAAGGIGLVPLDAVTGRARRVILSVSGSHWWQVWTWRANRIWVGLR